MRFLPSYKCYRPSAGRRWYAAAAANRFAYDRARHDANRCVGAVCGFIRASLEFLGKTIRPKKAKSIGLVDLVVEPLGPGLDEPAASTHAYLERIAVQTALDIAERRLKVERKRPFMEVRVSCLIVYSTGTTIPAFFFCRLKSATNYFLSRRPLLDSVVLRMARDKVLKQTYGNYPAPLKILESVRAGLVNSRQEGYEEEARVCCLLKTC